MAEKEIKELCWFWDPVEECIWDPRQILQRSDEVQERVTPVPFYDWINLIEHPIDNHHIGNIEGANIPGYVENPSISENELLEREKTVLEQWLRDHDYIGIKIATGRATVEEYAEEIEEMKKKADRINEIDRLLASGSVID